MAALTWICPVCRRTFPDEGTCDVHLVLLEVDRPEPPPVPDAGPVPPGAAGGPDGPRLAVEMPWGVLVDVPAQGQADIGRSVPPLNRDTHARTLLQISRQHLTITHDPDGTPVVVDTGSSNGTWLDGQPLERGHRYPVRAGQRLRLGLDVECRVIAVDEFGEPLP